MNEQLSFEDCQKLPDSGNFEADMDVIASWPEDKWSRVMGFRLHRNNQKKHFTRVDSPVKPSCCYFRWRGNKQRSYCKRGHNIMFKDGTIMAWVANCKDCDISSSQRVYGEERDGRY